MYGKVFHGVFLLAHAKMHGTAKFVLQQATHESVSPSVGYGVSENSSKAQLKCVHLWCVCTWNVMQSHAQSHVWAYLAMVPVSGLKS